MANSSFRKDIGTPDIGLVLIDGVINIQSGGVPTSDTLTFASASQTGTGAYRITLDQAFVSLKGATFTLLNTGSQGLQVVLSGSSMTSKTIDFTLQQLSASGAGGCVGVNRNPQNPVAVHCHLVFKNHTV